MDLKKTYFVLYFGNMLVLVFIIHGFFEENYKKMFFFLNNKGLPAHFKIRKLIYIFTYYDKCAKVDKTFREVGTSRNQGNLPYFFFSTFNFIQLV